MRFGKLFFLKVVHVYTRNCQNFKTPLSPQFTYKMNKAIFGVGKLSKVRSGSNLHQQSEITGLDLLLTTRTNERHWKLIVEKLLLKVFFSTHFYYYTLEEFNCQINLILLIKNINSCIRMIIILKYF